MATKKKLVLGLAAYGTGWDRRAWRLPESTSSGLTDPSVIVDIARTAERGKLDYIFAGSSLASEPQALQRVFRWDSFVFGGYAAAATKNVGLLVSVNSSYEHPFAIARQLATLDRFSNGRAALNVVFGIDREGGPTANYGRNPVPDEETKYSRAWEFTTVLNQLLYSWDQDLLLEDKENGVIVRPGSWRTIDFSGEHFEVRGPLNVPPPVQRSLPNVHVGRSEHSARYGAEFASVRFTYFFSQRHAQEEYKAHKARIAAAGRDPERFKIVPGIHPYIGGTVREAREKFREVEAFLVTQEIPAAFSRSFGIDLSGVSERERVIDVIDLESIGPDSFKGLTEGDQLRTGFRPSEVDDREWLRDIVLNIIDDENLTLGDLYRFVKGRRDAQHPVVLGDAKKIADWLEENLEAEALDGVQLFFPYHRGPADLFVDQAVPELQRRGLFRTEYEHDTLEENLGVVEPR